MSKPKHTPGPWELDADLVISHNTRDMRARDGVVVARIQEPTNYLGQSKANAALIAAAPEMLAALKLVDGFFPKDSINAKAVKNAIAKAEGKDK